MVDIRLIRILGICCMFYFQLDKTSGLFIDASRNVPSLVNQPVDVERENANEDFHIPPFLPFFSFFRHRYPFMPVEVRGTTTSTMSAEKREESKINDLLQEGQNKAPKVTEDIFSKNENSQIDEQPEKSFLQIHPENYLRKWRHSLSDAHQLVNNSPANKFDSSTEQNKKWFESQGHHISKKVIDSKDRKNKGHFLTERFPLDNLLHFRIWRNGDGRKEQDKSVGPLALSTIKKLNDTIDQNKKWRFESQGHHISKKVIHSKDRENKGHSLADKFPLDNLLDIRIWRNGDGRKEQDKSVAPLALFTIKKLNDTTGSVTNSSIMDEENCFGRRIIPLYFFVRTVNWASLALELALVLLITSIIAFGLFLCAHEQHGAHFHKIKPLNV